MQHIPPNQVSEHWDRVRVGLQRIIDKSPHVLAWAPGDVLCALASGSAHLALIDDDGFMIWQRLPGDDGRGMLFVWALEGKNLGQHLVPIEQALVVLAKHCNSKRIRIVGRKGWGRSKFWQPAGYVYEHEVQ